MNFPYPIGTMRRRRRPLLPPDHPMAIALREARELLIATHGVTPIAPDGTRIASLAQLKAYGLSPLKRGHGGELVMSAHATTTTITTMSRTRGIRCPLPPFLWTHFN